MFPDIVTQTNFFFYRWDSSWYKESKRKAKKDEILNKMTKSISQDISCKCGVSPLKTKIVNGKETPINKYPWMAAVMWVNDEGVLSQFCGGSIISDR